LIVRQQRFVAAQAAIAAKQQTSFTVAKAIPAVGMAVSLTAPVVRPAEKVYNTINNGIENGLKHIPIAGDVLALPFKASGAIVNSTLHFLGF
jgi:hypothetical protein